jgi:AbrB family looped-hinge helix DNA binding protein
MAIMRVSNKGQVVIPRELREKCGVNPGGKVEVMEQRGSIVIIPLPKDPIKGSRGMLKWGKSAKGIVKEMREEERKLEEGKIKRVFPDAK